MRAAVQEGKGSVFLPGRNQLLSKGMTSSLGVILGQGFLEGKVQSEEESGLAEVCTIFNLTLIQNNNK